MCELAKREFSTIKATVDVWLFGQKDQNGKTLSVPPEFERRFRKLSNSIEASRAEELALRGSTPFVLRHPRRHGQGHLHRIDLPLYFQMTRSNLGEDTESKLIREDITELAF
jgi:hypothetical protein